MASPQSAAFTKALDQALTRLKMRERFPAELHDWLISRGFDEETTERVLQRLTQRGLLSEERAIQAIVQKRRGKRAVGVQRLRADLLARGAPEEAMEIAVVEVSEEEAAREALSSKRSWKGKAQAGRFLASRGFSGEAIEAVLSKTFGEDQSPD